MEFGSHIEGSMFSHVYLLLLVRTYPINNEFCSKKKKRKKKTKFIGTSTTDNPNAKCLWKSKAFPSGTWSKLPKTHIAKEAFHEHSHDVTITFTAI